MAMAMAVGVGGGHRSLSTSGAFCAKQVWSNGGVKVQAVKMETGSDGGRMMARLLTVCNVVSSDSANAEMQEAKEESSVTVRRRLCGPPLRGKPLPFGATACEDGVNFAVHFSGAKAVSLCLFTESDLQQGVVTEEVPLHPIFNRTGNIWHIFLPDMQSNLLYGYRVDGPYIFEEGACYDARQILVDPYAK